jgi:glycosyltransferase involved in cell wall biosynthesis
MRKIKVYLQYPWKFPDSPYYKYLIENAQKNVEYLNVKKQGGVITNKKKFWFSNKMKKIIRKIINRFYPSLPNAHLSPKGDYDLIHCAHCLSKNKNKPWVADIEYPGQVWANGSSLNHKNKKFVKKILLDKNCKKIITWTKMMKNGILKIFPDVEDKIEVVYPIIPKIKIKKEEHKKIIISFVARYFYLKGGLHALEVINNLTRKYENVEGIIVSEIPKEIDEKYFKNKKIKFYSLMPQKELIEKVYSKIDIFLYPGYSDSFGFAIPEVMGMGVPVVSIDVSTRKEIISDGKNGFVVKNNLSQKELIDSSNKINEDLIKKLEDKCEILIEDKKLLRRFGNEAKKEIISGKFSAEKIKKQMEKIYLEALK